ncbi:MAG: hypothetical protein AB1779_04840 [Candidatus Thermoplasmatota archaeon]
MEKIKNWTYKQMFDFGKNSLETKLGVKIDVEYNELLSILAEQKAEAIKKDCMFQMLCNLYIKQFGRDELNDLLNKCTIETEKKYKQWEVLGFKILNILSEIGAKIQEKRAALEKGKTQT